MQFSVMNLRQIMYTNPFFRIDAEYRKQEYISLRNKIKKHKNYSLEFITTTIRKGIFDISPYEYLNDGVPFIRVQNIKNDFLIPSECVFISKDYSNKEHKTSLEEGDIAISKVGSIGNVCLVMDQANTSQNVISIKVKRDCINPFCLFAYLASQSGQKLMKQIQAIQVQSKLELHEVRNLPVPFFSDFFQNHIEFILRQSYTVRNDSVSKYTQAKTILLSELGLAKWQPKHRLWFIKNYSDTEQAERIDAEYYQPKYEEIINAIEGYSGGYSFIKDEFKQNKSTFDIDAERTYQYVEIGSVNISNGEISPSAVVGAELPANAKRVLKKDDVIVSKVRTYRGAVTIVEKNGCVSSGAFTILRENGRIKKETLLAFLHSKPLLAWSMKPNSGTSYPVIIDDDILNLPVPLLPEETQTEIQQKVIESFKLRKQSKIVSLSSVGRGNNG